MKNILITGAKGQLGSTLMQLGLNFPDFKMTGIDVDDLDLNDIEGLDRLITRLKIDILINCAAYTDVYRAEQEYDKALTINGLAMSGMANLAVKYNLKFVHISTDYVFDGKKRSPYSEDDMAHPINAYGKSKLQGETAILEVNPDNSAIIRTSWLFADEGKNFLNTVFELSKTKDEIDVVSDQIGSPTYATDLARAILTMLPALKSKGVKLYHFANSGSCSWYEFAQEIVRVSKNKCRVNPVNTQITENSVQRPEYSVLNTEKIQKTFHINLNNWKDSVAECIHKKMAL